MNNFLNKINYKKILKVLAVLFVLFWVGVFSLSYLYTKQEKEKQEKYLADLRRPYLEDKYGGATPEETFAMFLDALKKEDLDLASKYFIFEEQKERKEYFEKVKSVGRWQEMVNDLSRQLVYKDSLYEDNKQYEIKNTDGKIIFGLVDFVKYPSGVWKLTEL